MPMFSIIVPVYNVQNYLAACVKSVAEQPGPKDWECILVDDGSTDASPQLCDALAAESADSEAAQIYPNVLVVKEGRESDPAILALAAALQSGAVRDFINETYGGAVVPLF